MEISDTNLPENFCECNEILYIKMFSIAVSWCSTCDKLFWQSVFLLFSSFSLSSHKFKVADWRCVCGKRYKRYQLILFKGL